MKSGLAYPGGKGRLQTSILGVGSVKMISKRSNIVRQAYVDVMIVPVLKKEKLRQLVVTLDG